MPVIPNARLSDDWPSSLLQVIGQVVIAAGQLEHVLDLSYKRLTKRNYSQGQQEAADLFRLKQKTKKVEEAAKSRGLSHSDCTNLGGILRRAENA